MLIINENCEATEEITDDRETAQIGALSSQKPPLAC
jgi:hypothetical protein